MPRVLPWEHDTGPSTSKSRAKIKVQDGDSPPSDSDQAPRASKKRKHSNSDQSDHEDDENWRMTESELVATAKLWTRDLHQQAYERLLRVQEKESERSRTLTDLLDEPVPEQQLPSLPPRIIKKEIEPEIRPSVHAAKSVKRSALVESKRHVASISKPSDFRAKEELSLEGDDSVAILPDLHKADGLPRSTIPKLSKAALARRQKREQNRRNDDAVAPMF